tara:strand:- start:1557 stop:2726 length:1170 start_codon:yes stop_codon:yes gene_type:complete
MITINVIDDKICGSYGDTPFAVQYTEETYASMMQLADEASSVTTMDDYKTIMSEFAELCVVDYTKTVESKCAYIHVNKNTGEFFLKSEGVVSSIPMPQALVDRIFESIDKGVSFEPLVKMWIRWLRNPVLAEKAKSDRGIDFSNRFFNFVNMQYVHPKLKEELMEEQGLSETIAADRATMYQMKITREGLLNGYKVSREIMHKYDTETGDKIDRYARTFNPDTGEIQGEGFPEHVEDRLFEPAMMGSGGDSFSCIGDNGFANPGHFIKVGCTHSLASWSQVNTNDNQSCVKGLHIGGLKYIAFYSGEIHNIFADPMHIGAVPDDVDGAIRCKQYFVHSSLAGVNGSIYHSSTYAAMTDAEWQEMRSEAVKVKLESKAQVDKEVAELNAL